MRKAGYFACCTKKNVYDQEKCKKLRLFGCQNLIFCKVKTCEPSNNFWRIFFASANCLKSNF